MAKQSVLAPAIRVTTGVGLLLLSVDTMLEILQRFAADHLPAWFAPWFPLIVSLLLGAAGIVLLAWGRIASWWRRRKPRTESREPRESDAMAILRALTDDTLELRSGREVAYEGPKRPVLSFTIGELRDKLKSHPSIQHEGLVAPYLGKWMPVEGEVRDIGRRGEVGVVHLRTGATFFSVDCRFSDVREVEHVRPEDRIRLIGKLKALRTVDCDLEECEVLS